MQNIKRNLSQSNSHSVLDWRLTPPSARAKKNKNKFDLSQDQRPLYILTVGRRACLPSIKREISPPRNSSCCARNVERVELRPFLSTYCPVLTAFIKRTQGSTVKTPCWNSVYVVMINMPAPNSIRISQYLPSHVLILFGVKSSKGKKKKENSCVKFLRVWLRMLCNQSS